MSKRLIGSFLALIGSALLLVACQAIDNSSNSLLGYAARRGSPVTIHFRGARKSHKWRGRGRFRRLITFATPIQHIFIISMENRTVENLFGAYYGQTWNGPGGGFWQDPNNFNLRDPNASPTLKPNSLSKHFNPNHGHDKAWWYDSQGLWSNAPIGCPNLPCPDYATPYSIVPTSETSIYASLVANWAFVNNVLQANQGPSFVAHQYYIAAQSGGIQGSLSSPDAEAENPGNPPAPDPTGNYIDSDNEDLETSGCNPGGYTVKSINMSLPVASPTPLDNGGKISACEEYTSNILDETLQTFGNPPDEDWQYIAHANNSIWAAPLGVAHLWNAYNNGIKQIASFAVDPDAVNFVRNITGGKPNPKPCAPDCAAYLYHAL